MKMNKQRASYGIFLKQTLQILRSFTSLRLLAATLAFWAAGASAAILTWDAGNTNNGATIDPGSGAWDTDTTTNLNWNNGSGNVSWTQTGTTTPLNGATFNGPDAAAGTYQVSVDGGQVAATNLTINANGYVFSGSPIFLNGSGSKGNFQIADGKNVVISNNVTGSGNVEYLLGNNGSPSSVTVYGNISGFTPTFSSTNGSILYLAGTNSASIGNFLTDVRQTNGTYNSGSAFVIGRNGGSLTQPANATGSFTVDGPTTILNQSSDYIYLGRNLGSGSTPWNATLTIQNGATVNYQTGAANNNLGLTLPRNTASGANCISRVFMYGGTLNMGPGTEASPSPRPIYLMDGGSQPGQVATLVQTGGVINAWSGIIIGGPTTTRTGGSAMITNSGGFLYIGSIGNNGIRYGANIPPTNNISLSGGTVGALGSWISSVPMTLATLNGNITFQCADSNGNPFNISLSGALTGAGGFNKSGGGQLTLSGLNSYAGSTVVSNGFLQVVTSGVSSTNGALTVDGSAGTPTVAIKVSNQGQNWHVGTLTTVNNGTATPTLDFQHGSIIPSGSVGAIQVAGDVNYTVTPIVSVTNDTALAVGKYPLIQYTGAANGTPPTAVTLPASGYCSGYVSNSAAAKTLFLVITQSTYIPAIVWTDGTGNHLWNFTSLNWSGPSLYVDGDGVTFDDTASGTAVLLNTTVNPLGVTFNNLAKSYSVTGTGNITGSGGLTVLGGTGGGTVALSTTNTYTGGTTVTGPGQLNINYGGTGGSDSAIGTGTLTLNTGAKIDNTSGHAVMLNTATPIPINMVDDWTFAGTTNLDLGLGQVTLGNLNVVLTVVSNTLTVNNPITDNGLNYKLTKAGNGALTLSNASSYFTGGLELLAGTLNINSDSSAGYGEFTVSGGVLDNTSGDAVTLSTPSKVNMFANFTFKGTTNLTLSPSGGTGQINIGNNTITLNGAGTLDTGGAFLGGNRVTTVNGTGKWVLGGIGNNGGLTMVINGGTIYFNKLSGVAESNPIQINTGGSVVILNPNGAQITAGVQVTLGGGMMDLNGDTENVGTVIFNSGILRNSASGTAAALPTAAVTLGNAGCVFDVPAVDSSLTVSNASGSGGLILTGLGLVNISSNGYAGNTTISNGTLVLNFPTLGTNSTVTVNTNATLGTNGVLTLNFPNAETNTVAALILGGVSKPNGVYSATTDPAYIAGSGSLQVVTLINPRPGPILFSASGSTLSLSWPTNGGWILQSQTNLLSNPWFDVPGSGSVTSTNITINPASPKMFFRLHRPF